jgi:DNA-binding response OmpR family regulator
VNITPPPAAANLKRGIVLLVEDDQDLRETLEMTLRNHGHQVESASDGSAALSWLRRADPHPCLVLLDLMMPGMSGFELRSRMAEDPALAAVPVVVITGAGVLADQRSGELGAEILRKPVGISTLLGTVNRYCLPAVG